MVLEFKREEGWFICLLKMPNTNCEDCSVSGLGLLSPDLGALFMFSWWVGELLKCCSMTKYLVVA